MSNTLFILGAGASRQAGAPLMSDFLRVADHVLKQGKVEKYRNHFVKVMNGKSALQAVHSKSKLEIDNIEVLFSAFEMAEALGIPLEFNGVRLESLIESLKILIAATIEASLELPVEGGTPEAPRPYGSFASLVEYLTNRTQPGESVAVITFNYDLACEYAFFRANIPVSYALECEPIAKEGMPLLKLHGSLNWANCPEKSQVVPYTIENHFRKHSWVIDHYKSDSVPRSVALKFTPHLADFKWDGNAVIPEPVIVPPTWNKTGYQGNMRCVWRRAAKEMREAENIFVIGYSLPETDSFFRHLYALGSVGTVMLKRFCVFDPDPSGLVHKRFRNLLGPGAADKYEPRKETFEMAIPIIKTFFPYTRH